MNTELPTNLEAEAALLGALLMNNGRVERTSFLSPEHFSEPVHQRIYAAIRSLAADGMIANPLTLGKHFEGDEALDGIGGAKYLGMLAKRSGSVIDAQDYANLLIDLYQRREMIRVFETTRDVLLRLEYDNPADKIAAEVMSSCEKILREKPRQSSAKVRDIAMEVVRGLEMDSPAFSTGYEKLDMAMEGGIYPEKAYGFAARKKVGKTIFAAGLSYSLNRAGVPHLFICGEMSPVEVEARNMARALNVFPSEFRQKDKSEAFKKRAGDYACTMANNVIYERAPALTFDKLKSICQLGILDHGIKGFILDYLQLVGGKEAKKSTSEHIDEVAQWIADFCRKNKLWAIVMAQINQEGNTRGGEGMRLAFDQVYQINRDDITMPEMWLEMMDTRYTKWMNIGEKGRAGYVLQDRGLFFQEQ